jgi:hypothetical protein
MFDAGSRKIRLCELIRATAASFIRETGGDPCEDARLRSEIDCLLALYESGAIDPVDQSAPSVAIGQEISLH